MKTNNRFVDINDIEAKVGDIIIAPKYSDLSKHIILGFTANYIIVSSYSKCHTWSDGCAVMFTTINNNVLEHNSKQYYHGHSFVIMGRNFDIPEKLIKFVKSY